MKEPTKILFINAVLPLLIAAMLGIIGPNQISQGIALVAAVALVALNANGVWTVPGKWRLGYALLGIGNLLALVFFADFSLASLLVTWLRLI